MGKDNIDRKMSRRKFLGSVTKTGMVGIAGVWGFPGLIKYRGLSIAEPRLKNLNPYRTADGKPILVVARGSSDFQQLLQAGLDALGGLDKLVDNNQDVLIKPNFNHHDNYPGISSVDSIATLAREVVNVTTGNVMVGDQGYYPSTEVYLSTDLVAGLEGSGAEAIHFSGTTAVRRFDWDVSHPTYNIYTDVHSAPIIINFPLIKRHHTGRMTTAIKNNVGTIAGPGAVSSRDYLHSLSSASFLRELAHIASVIQPELTVVDARSILTVTGPSTTYGQVVNDVNTVIIGCDIVSVDAYCAQLLDSYDPTFEKNDIYITLSEAETLGLGERDLNDVQIIETTVSSISDDSNTIPINFRLEQNVPNPFNAETSVGFEIHERSTVRITLYDILGRKVQTLIDRMMMPGKHFVRFSAGGLPTGTYYYRMEVGSQVQTKSMTLIQ